MKKCDFCGKLIDGDSDYCLFCGQKQSQISETNDSSKIPLLDNGIVTVKKPNRNKKIKLLVATSILVVVIIILIVALIVAQTRNTNSSFGEKSNNLESSESVAKTDNTATVSANNGLGFEFNYSIDSFISELYISIDYLNIDYQTKNSDYELIDGEKEVASIGKTLSSNKINCYRFNDYRLFSDNKSKNIFQIQVKEKELLLGIIKTLNPNFKKDEVQKLYEQIISSATSFSSNDESRTIKLSFYENICYEYQEIQGDPSWFIITSSSKECYDDFIETCSTKWKRTGEYFNTSNQEKSDRIKAITVINNTKFLDASKSYWNQYYENDSQVTLGQTIAGLFYEENPKIDITRKEDDTGKVYGYHVVITGHYKETPGSIYEYFGSAIIEVDLNNNTCQLVGDDEFKTAADSFFFQQFQYSDNDQFHYSEHAPLPVE